MDNRLSAHYAAAPGNVLGALFSFAPILALSLDASGRVARASEALCTLLGLAQAHVSGRPLADLMPDPDAAAFRDNLWPRLLHEGRLAGADIALRTASGQTMPFGVFAVAELDGRGAVLGAMVVLEDLRESRAALAALDQKAMEAEEASAAKSRFLAAMSHEIRTPMNAILGFAQLLEMSDLDATRAGHVRAILSAGQAMMGLLTDLLDLGQVEAGQMRIEPRAFDLHAMLRDVERWWHDPAAEKGLTLRVIREGDLPRVVVSDPGRIQQVLNNYLGNAVKFTGSGHVALGVALDPGNGAGALAAATPVSPDVSPGIPPAGAAAPGPGRTGGPVLRFRVSDSGPGISPEHVARLYRPFVRIEGEGRGPRTGWGLGLSICANIAEAMGAEVGVETDPGAGATFWFDVPVGLPPAVPDDAPALSAAPAPDPGPSRRVLLVEDNALNHDVMRRMLEEMGHIVLHAGNGFDALDTLETTRVDVVVMDVMMPGLGGIAATRRLRAASHAQAGVPVIACSAHVSPEDEASYRDAGMTAFLPKPVDRAALARAVAEAGAEAGARQPGDT